MLKAVIMATILMTCQWGWAVNMKLVDGLDDKGKPIYKVVNLPSISEYEKYLLLYNPDSQTFEVTYSFYEEAVLMKMDPELEQIWGKGPLYACNFQNVISADVNLTEVDGVKVAYLNVEFGPLATVESYCQTKERKYYLQNGLTDQLKPGESIVFVVPDIVKIGRQKRIVE